MRTVKIFSPLALLYALLKDQPAFVTTEPPSDLGKRLPALVIEVLAPRTVGNAPAPGLGAKTTVTVNALASDDQVARELAEGAYRSLWGSRNRVTENGWIVGLKELQAPFLVTSEKAAPHVFQYSFAAEITIRQ